MRKLTFLSGSVPLTKTYSLNEAGLLIKSPYPNISQFTSHEVHYETLEQLYTALVEAAAAGCCLLKGHTARPLVNESRAGSTDRLAASDLMCLDLDQAPYATVDDALSALEFSRVSYVVQYSASMGIVAGSKLSAHVFLMLTDLVRAPVLKQWLMHKNLSVASLRSGLCLSKTGAALSWPLDITACQNDKLIYLADPIVKSGVINTFSGDRIQLIQREETYLSTSRIVCPPLEELKEQARELMNEKRAAAGIKPLRKKIAFVGGHEVQGGVGEATLTESWTDRGFVYFNLNGGDSGGYYHPVDDFTYIFNFKGEPTYLTKELLPDYYKDQLAAQTAERQAPSESGEILLAFRDLKTATYWNGTWNAEQHNLQLHQARNETQLEHWMMAHGKTLGEFVPIWNLKFDPTSDTVVDAAAKECNTFVSSPYYRLTTLPTKPNSKSFPIISRIIDSCVGTGEIQTHFMNWVACLLQYRCKLGTAWVLHGVEGTGKGLFFHEVLSPLLGAPYVVLKRSAEIDTNFNGWMERSLLVYVDEMEIGALTRESGVMSDLKSWITEPHGSIRNLFAGAVMRESYTNFIFASNKGVVVHISENDRRFNVGEHQESKLVITADEVAAIKDELPAFFAYMMEYKASLAQARVPLETETKRQMAAASQTSLDHVAAALHSGNLPFFWDSMADENAVQSMVGSVYSAGFRDLIIRTVRELSPTGALHSVFTRDELGVIFEYCVGKMPSSPHKLISMLRQYRLPVGKIVKHDKIAVGIEIEWKVTPEWLAARKAEIDAPKVRLVSHKHAEVK